MVRHHIWQSVVVILWPRRQGLGSKRVQAAAYRDETLHQKGVAVYGRTATIKRCRKVPSLTQGSALSSRFLVQARSEGEPYGSPPVSVGFLYANVAM
jgi:hypothetical protein